MSQKELTTYENAAVTRAKEQAVSSFMDAILALMWERGIKSLDDVDGETFAALERDARMDKGVHSSLEKFMKAYADHLDKVLSGEEAPF